MREQVRESKCSTKEMLAASLLSPGDGVFILPAHECMSWTQSQEGAGSRSQGCWPKEGFWASRPCPLASLCSCIAGAGCNY